MADIGRPETTDEQYQKFIDAMAPFLKLGETLNHAIDDAGLQKNKPLIYNKYKLNDWFLEKIDVLRSYPGKIVNNILANICLDVSEKIKQGRQVTEDEMKNVRFFAEKHRTSQSYFVNRTETATADPAKVGKILDTMDTDYGQLGSEASKQMVADDPLIQNKG